MICEHCKKRFEPGEDRVCPHCGEPNLASGSGVLRSSTIVISAGPTEAVYRSVKEVPPPLRTQLLKSTNGINSGTILIADKRGRQEIARAIGSLPLPLKRRLWQAALAEDAAGPAGQPRSPLLRRAVVLAVILLALVALWFALTHHWGL